MGDETHRSAIKGVLSTHQAAWIFQVISHAFLRRRDPLEADPGVFVTHGPYTYNLEGELHMACCARVDSIQLRTVWIRKTSSHEPKSRIITDLASTLIRLLLSKELLVTFGLK